MILLIFTGLAYLQNHDLDSEMKKLDNYFEKKMASLNIVGSALWVVHQDKIIYQKNYGYAKLQEKIPSDNHTIYDWGSITKLFTGIAVMQLRDRGKLQLNDPVVKWIPTLKNIHNPYHNTESMTIEQLMSHTSGLQTSSFPIDLTWDAKWPNWSQIEAVFPYMKVENQPGDMYNYSNLGVLLLGRIIEVITDDDYEIYMDKNVLKPLQMYQSYFDSTPYHLKNQKSFSYNYNNATKSYKPFTDDANHGGTTSNGGLKTSIADMTKFARFLINYENSEIDYSIILNRKSLEEMFNTQTGIEANKNRTVCLSFFKDQYGNYTLLYHGGTANGFISLLVYNPETDTVFFTVINTAIADGEKFRQDIKEYFVKNILPLLV
jgi:CubicO group peptidase (beta-lactamase class C family)